MALNFPSVGLTVGQKYPAAPVAGVPTYTWDGEKWTKASASTYSTMTLGGVQVISSR